MKNRLPLSVIALSLGLVLSAHKCANDNAADAMTTIGEGRWDLKTLAGKAVELPAGAETPYLSLDTKTNEVSGFGGCNTLRGGLTVQGNDLSFGQVMSTKKYCEGIQPTENALMDALRTTTAYKLDGNTLTLLNAGKELATLVKHP
jgi:putative lipoprotein